MDEVEVQDIDFLYGCANPTIIIIHQDTMGRHIKAKELSIKDKEFAKVKLHLYILYYFVANFSFDFQSDFMETRKC